jgi:hypothetical protein
MLYHQYGDLKSHLDRLKQEFYVVQGKVVMGIHMYGAPLKNNILVDVVEDYKENIPQQTKLS